MDAILCGALGLVQSSLNTEVCSRFHRVVFVVLPETEQDQVNFNLNKVFISNLVIVMNP